MVSVQEARQTENKAALAAWLTAHPLQWTDGKLYGVTEEDQQEMALNLMQYQVSVQAGQPAVLEWHAQKESCRTFEQSEYVALSLAIAVCAYPYLRYQESVKEDIYEAQTARRRSPMSKSTMRASAAKYAYLAWFGGSCYVTFEVFWRGRSHWTMFLLAAFLFLIIGGLNEIWTSWRLIPQAVAGALIATAAELITGCIVNLWLGWGI